jgi:hypothetical protein
LLRFNTRRNVARGARLKRKTGGVWALLVLLGAVLLLMRWLDRPQAADLLARALQDPRAASGVSRQPAEQEGASSGNQPALPGDPESAAAWSHVKDNALFSAAEHDAWFLVWKELQETPASELRRQSLGRVAYAQLVGQPDVYRGKSVHVRGWVIRESVKAAPKNSLGLAEYHQLVIAPLGGGQWPFVVYCRDLPAGFPRGEGLREAVGVDALFFKNWSYPYEGGMGLAPVLVATTIDWTAPAAVAESKARSVDVTTLVVGGASALLAALLFVAWVVRHTRRPRVGGEPAPDFASLDSSP